MADPFRAEVVRERMTRAVGLALLIVFLSAIVFVWVRAQAGDGRNVQAVVMRIGTYADPLGTGDLPILTVRLPDGSIHQVTASWPAVDRCTPGSSVPLVQRGTSLRVALSGCRPRRS